MFGIGWPELIAAGLVMACVVMALRWGPRTRWQSVDDRWRVAVPPDDLEPALSRLLAALPAAAVRSSSPGTWTLTVSRAPWWTLIPAVLLFPIGVLFPLLVRERAEMQVLITGSDDGTEVRLLGTTRSGVRDTVAEALAGLPRLSDRVS